MYIHKYFFCRLMRGSRACHACWLSAVCGLIIRLNATVLRTGGNIGQFNPKGLITLTKWVCVWEGNSFEDMCKSFIQSSWIFFCSCCAVRPVKAFPIRCLCGRTAPSSLQDSSACGSRELEYKSVVGLTLSAPYLHCSIVILLNGPAGARWRSFKRPVRQILG